MMVRYIWLSFTLSKILGATLLATLSFYLARDKQYEASMGAAGVAVAVATMSFDVKQKNDDETENFYSTKIHELELQNVRLNEQIQASEKIHKLEVELAVLKHKNTQKLLPEGKEANLISESFAPTPGIAVGISKGKNIFIDESVAKNIFEIEQEIEQED